VTACYSFHGYELRDVARVALGNGVTGQALSYSSDRGQQEWTIVYWIWPVKMASGTRYERVILYLQNTAEETVQLPAGAPQVTGLKNDLDAKAPADERLITNRAFLVDFAKQLIAAQTQEVDTNVTLANVAAQHGNNLP
jgi:hypothetical protein